MFLLFSIYSLDHNITNRICLLHASRLVSFTHNFTLCVTAHIEINLELFPCCGDNSQITMIDAKELQNLVALLCLPRFTDTDIFIIFLTIGEF